MNIEENTNNVTREKITEVRERERSSSYHRLENINNKENKIISNDFGVIIQKIDPVFIDERGIITDLLNEPISHVGLITTEKDAVRANHYHKLSTQYSYILQGKFEVLIAPYDQQSNIKKVIVNVGELITIPPYVIHQFKALDRAIMIDMVSESRAGAGFEDDTVRVKINEN